VAPSNSISFDEVLGLLRGPVLRDFENAFVASRQCARSPEWGDSQQLTRELASAGITSGILESMLTSQRDEVAWMQDTFIWLRGPLPGKQNYPEGYEPGDGEKDVIVESPGPRTFGAGFGLRAACTLWLLDREDEAAMIDWLKLRRIPNARQYAGQLRRAHHARRQQAR
jgi:hypothetical protein